MRKFVSALFVLLLSLALLPAIEAHAADDPYWPQSVYDNIEKTITDNVPKVKDANGQYIYETVDGTFTYSVKLTDFQPRKSIEDVFSARPSGSGSILTRREVDDWTWAFRAALQDVVDHGGGTVVVPRGTYVTGAIRYRGNNTRIHLEDGVEIQFIRNLQYGTNVRSEPTTMLPPVEPKDGEWDDWYPQEKTRYECRDFYGYSPLIYAYDLKNIALTGAGNGGRNAITGDGRPATSEEDIDGNDYPDGYIEPEPGAPLSIINGMADSRNMRTFTATLPVYADDNTTVLAPTGTVMAHTINPATSQPVLGTTGASVTYSTWITNLMNAWEPIEKRKIPDLLPLDTPGLSEAQKESRNFRRVNQYRATFIEPHGCQNVLISDFYLRNSPFWELHPTYSQNVRVKGLHINSHGGNNDGCDPDSSQYVLIEDNIFNTGDDCIAIKCGRDNDAYEPWNMPSTHIIVRNNLMKDGHGGIVSGSEMGGGVEWVFSHRNVYDSPNLFFGLRVKTNSSRGGYVRHVYIKDTEIKALMAAFATVNFYYDNDSDTRVPTASDIYVSNCYSPPGGFTTMPKLGLIMAKQYGNSPISGIHFKDCTFEGFYQSPNNASNPNRPVTNLIAIAEGGIEYDNVLIDGQLYQPPEKSATINKLILTRSSDPSDVREITKPEDIQALINESRTGADKNWDISIVAKVDGFDYKGKHYDISDTIENSTYSGPLGGASQRETATLLEKHNGGVLYVNGRSPFISDADREYPYYKASGIPAYEAFVRVNSRHTVGSTNNVNDWGIDVETFDVGPNYVVDLRTPGRVTSLGDGEYLIKLRENVNMGNDYTVRAGVIMLSKVEVVLRNALYPDDQDFVFYSALPTITGTKIDVSKKLFVMNFDRPMNPGYLSDLANLDIKLSANGSAVSIDNTGVWSDDGTSVSYNILETVDTAKFYTVDAFDPTSKVLSYRGNVPTIGANPNPDPNPDSGSGDQGGSAGGSTAVPTVTTSPAITVNGATFAASLQSDGTLAITLSAAEVTKYLGGKASFDAAIPGQTFIQLSLPISALGTTPLSIATDFGTVNLPAATLQAIKTQFGDTLTLAIKKGSFSAALIVNGKEVTYNDPKNPLTLSLPGTISSGKNSAEYVLVKKGSGKDTILPLGMYKNGKITSDVASTGTYDVIYNGKSFTDTNHWAKDYIAFVTARELFLGTGGNLFSPDSSVTRGMFAAVLARLDGSDLSGYTTPRFSDVSTGQYYSAPVEWAADKGIVNGVGNGKFNPDQNITREQMAVMLINYVKYKGYALPAKTSAAFNDESGVASWAKDAVKSIQAAGIINGKSGNVYDPQGIATRAEMTAVFARFVEGLAK